MTTRHKPPPPIAVLYGSHLSPASAYDAERLDEYANGTEFNLVARTKRSNPQLNTYWKALKIAVDATGLWPTDKALHIALKVDMGRLEPIYGVSGKMKGKVIGMQADSTAFDAMTHREFCQYMDEAMAALSEAIGSDALAWMEGE